MLRDAFYRIVNAVQGTTGTPEQASGHGFLHTIEHIFTLKSSTLYLVAAAAAAYAVLEGVEAVGLWYQKRWAEYLTFVATVAFIPYEIYELTRTLSTFKILALRRQCRHRRLSALCEAALRPARWGRSRGARAPARRRLGALERSQPAA